MAVSYREWYFQLWDSQRKISIDDDTAQLLVLTANAPTAPSIYSDANGTAVSNPVRTPRTFSNGAVRFWTDMSVTNVDLSLVTSKGQSYFFEDVSYSTHRLDVDPFDREHILVVPFGASNATEVDTGIDLPANLIIKDAFIKVSTTDSGKTIDLGILSSESGGAANGLVLATSVATSGYVNQYGVVTNGTNIDYVVHTAGRGAFLKQGIAGADAIATVGGVMPRYYVTDGVAKSITYTGSSGSSTAAGYMVLLTSRLP